MNSTQTLTKTFTPDAWFTFQKQDAVIEVISIERTANTIAGEFIEIRVTFVWQS